MNLSKDQITKMINTVWEAVEDSKAGRIEGKVNGISQIYQIPFQTFLTTLSALMPHNVDSKFEIKEPPETWKGA
jgi:hypothetical protein